MPGFFLHSLRNTLFKQLLSVTFRPTMPWRPAAMLHCCGGLGSEVARSQHQDRDAHSFFAFFS